MIERRLLTDICRPKQWKTIATKDFTPDGYPVYGANGIIGFFPKYTHENPTLAITCRGATCGEIHITRPYSYINGNAMALDDLSDDADIRYLYYFLRFRGLRDVISGSAQPQITRSNLESVEVPVPPLETQKRIADVLDKAQELIDKRKQQIEMLDEFVQSVFLDMFGDPKTNSRGWESREIHQIATVGTGGTPKRDNLDYYLNGNIPWIKTAEVKGMPIYQAEEFIAEKAIEETNCKVFPENTILLAMYGQGQTRGRAGLMKIEAATNQACAAILPSSGINADFLFWQLRLRYEEIRELGRGGNQPNLNLSMVRALRVICPPLKLQERFRDLVRTTEQKQTLMENSLAEMENAFNSIMQRAFKGELFN